MFSPHLGWKWINLVTSWSTYSKKYAQANYKYQIISGSHAYKTPRICSKRACLSNYPQKLKIIQKKTVIPEETMHLVCEKGDTYK